MISGNAILNFDRRRDRTILSDLRRTGWMELLLLVGTMGSSYPIALRRSNINGCKFAISNQLLCFYSY